MSMVGSIARRLEELLGALLQRLRPLKASLRGRLFWVFLVTVCLMVAAPNLTLGWGTLAVLVGALIGGVGSLMTLSTSQDKSTTPCPDKNESLADWPLAGFGFLSVAAVLLVAAFVVDAYLPGVAWLDLSLGCAGILAALFGATFIDIQIDQGKVKYARWWCASGLTLIAVSLAVFFLWPAPPSGEAAAVALLAAPSTDETPTGAVGSMLSFVLLLSGMTLARIGLPEVLDPKNAEQPGYREIRSFGDAVALIAGAGAVGVLFWWPARPNDVLQLLMAFLFVGVAAAVLVEKLLRIPSDGASGKVLARFLSGGSALLAAAGIWILHLTIDTPWGGATETVVFGSGAFGMALLGAFFVLRGEGGFIVLLIGFAVMWTLVDRDDAVQELDSQGGVVIGFGDSYMAGQGATSFYKGNNTHSELKVFGLRLTRSGSDCRRSPEALPAQFAAVETEAGRELSSYNLACSGAKIENIKATAKYDDNSDVAGSRTQIQEFKDLLESHDGLDDRIERVLVSIGGNDVAFSTVIAACLLPADCSELALSFSSQIDDGFTEDLTEAYTDISNAVGDHVDVTVVPYPEFFTDKILDGDDGGCHLPISDLERLTVLEFQRTLNRQIAKAAVEANKTTGNVTLFERGEQAYKNFGPDGGRMICDDTPGANFLHLVPHSGVSGFLPTTWLQGSMHPRPDGHRRAAEHLSSGIPKPNSLAQTEQTERELSLTTDTISVSEPRQWITRNALEAARIIMPALALIFISGISMALAAYYSWGRHLKPASRWRLLFPDVDNDRCESAEETGSG